MKAQEGEKPAGRKFPLWTKLTLGAGVLLMLASGAVLIGGNILINKVTAPIPQETLLPTDLRPTGETIDGALNILMIGIDQRTNQDNPVRTDTMMIAHIPKEHDRIYLISLPRDWRVNIPKTPNGQWNGAKGKLTEAFAHGNLTDDGKPDLSAAGRTRGVEALARTINGMVPGGLKFNAVALIDFEGFEDVTNVLGGVYMCVDQTTESVHYNKDGVFVGYYHKSSEKMKVYKKGECRDMKPWEALDYVRQRDLPNGDYDRQRHQQQFMMAIFKKMTSKQILTDLDKVNALTKSAGKLFTLDLNGVPLIDWLFSFRHLGPENIQLVQQNGGNLRSLNINGTSFEEFGPENAALLKAVQQDTVTDFLVKNPTWLTKLPKT